MSENDKFAQELAQHQEKEYERMRQELEDQIEAGFRLKSQETAKEAEDRHNRDKREQRAQDQKDDAAAALAKAQEYEDENLRKAREAGKDVAGNQEESNYGYAAEKPTTATATMRDIYAAQNNETEGYQNNQVSNEDATTYATGDTAQTVTYDMEGNETQSNTASFSQEPFSFEMNANETNEMPQTMQLSINANEAPHNTQAANLSSPAQNPQQQDYDVNDPFAAWRAENQMRSATLDMNQSEQFMYGDDLTPKDQGSYSAGSAQPAAMGSFTQDLSDDNRVLYKTIRTANTDETGPIEVGPRPDTHTGNTHEGTTPMNAKEADSENRIYVNDQTFASRFEDTIFWKSDERKKAWEQFVNAFKNAKTLEDMIENGLWASLEIGLDMINAYMDWEVAESKKLAAFIKESKKTYDAEQMKASGISPQEGYKRTHDAVHAAKDFWTTFEKQDFYNDLPKNEWGGIDLKNCSNEQKAMLSEFQIRYAQSSPEFKQSMENMLGREFNAEDIDIAARGTGGVLHGYEDGPQRQAMEKEKEAPQGPAPEGPQKSGPDSPQPQGPAPTHLSPNPSFTREVTQPQIDLRNEPIHAPNRALENRTPNQLENKVDAPDIYRMDPLNKAQENVVIDGNTGKVLDGVQVPDKDTMRNVTPPKGPLKNARPADFADLPQRASNNIRKMHDIGEAMQNNRFAARLIEQSRNGGRPAAGGREANLTLTGRQSY